MKRKSVRVQNHTVVGIGLLLATAAIIVMVQMKPTSDAPAPESVATVGYINTRGSAPAPAPVERADEFLQWQQDLKRRLSRLFEMNELKSQTAVTELVKREHPGGDLIRETLTFRSFDGTRIPAVLQRRAGIQRKQPAVLLIPGHTRPEESGLTQLVSDETTYQHAAATALARAGFITLTFELRGFGALGQALNTEHRLVAYNALLEGSFYKRIVLSDATYALAVLRGSHFVDSSRIGVAGASFGGEVAVTLAALQEDVAAIYFSGFGGHAGPYQFAAGGRDDQPHYCHIIPGMKALMRREDMILLLAPRPALGTRGEREGPPSDEFMCAAQGAWDVFGAGSGFSYAVVPGGGHEFFTEDATEFFKQNLGEPDDAS